MALDDFASDLASLDFSGMSREDVLAALVEAAQRAADDGEDAGFSVSCAGSPCSEAHFYSPDQARDHRGRWTAGGGSGGGGTTAEERASARENRHADARAAVAKFLAGKGSPTKAEVAAVAEHLAGMTVKQLQGLRQEHGLKDPRLLKADLVTALHGYFVARRGKAGGKGEKKDGGKAADKSTAAKVAVGKGGGPAQVAAAMRQVEGSGVEHGSMVLTRDIRRALPGTSREEFDRTLLGMVEQGVLSPVMHNQPSFLTDAERREMWSLPAGVVSRAGMGGADALQVHQADGRVYFAGVSVADPEKFRALAAGAPAAPEPAAPEPHPLDVAAAGRPGWTESKPILGGDRAYTHTPTGARVESHGGLHTAYAAGLVNLGRHGDAAQAVKTAEASGRPAAPPPPQTGDVLKAHQTQAGADRPPEPGFTGVDRLGRRWENGELVARQEAQAGADARGAGKASAPLSHEALLSAMRRLEPGAERGHMVSVRNLRRSLPGVSGEDFDRAVLSAGRAGLLDLHAHDLPSSLTPAERAELVVGEGGRHYNGAVIRAGALEKAAAAPAAGKAGDHEQAGKALRAAVDAHVHSMHGGAAAHEVLPRARQDVERAAAGVKTKADADALARGFGVLPGKTVKDTLDTVRGQVERRIGSLARVHAGGFTPGAAPPPAAPAPAAGRAGGFDAHAEAKALRDAVDAHVAAARAAAAEDDRLESRGGKNFDKSPRMGEAVRRGIEDSNARIDALLARVPTKAAAMTIAREHGIVVAHGRSKEDVLEEVRKTIRQRLGTFARGYFSLETPGSPATPSYDPRGAAAFSVAGALPPREADLARARRGVEDWAQRVNDRQRRARAGANA